MHWVYILECDQGRLYVGETTRLFRRFWEHNTGRGGLNTNIYKPREIVALYKVQTIGKFMKYNESVSISLNEPDNEYVKYNKWGLIKFDDDEENKHNHLDAENFITECLGMHMKDKWSNIRGGKYVRFNTYYSCPTDNKLLNLPLCECGYPCDIRKKEEKNCLFFRCAKKNMWEGFKDVFDVSEPCKFYKEYTLDMQFKKEDEERVLHFKRILAKSASWLKSLPANDQPCVCCGEEFYDAVKLDFKRALCVECFLNKNEEAEMKCTPFKRKMILSVFSEY